MPHTTFHYFFFNATAPTEIYTLSLHDALPISRVGPGDSGKAAPLFPSPGPLRMQPSMARTHSHNPLATRRPSNPTVAIDRKSTRLNSSHSQISYAVFCLKKKKNDCTH